MASAIDISLAIQQIPKVKARALEMESVDLEVYLSNSEVSCWGYLDDALTGRCGVWCPG
jgi:hypothetical protein